MARFVDYAALTVISFLLTLVWATLLFDSWTAVFAFASAAALIVLVTAVYIKRGTKKPCSCDRLTIECAVRPPSYLIGLLKSAADNPACEYGANYVLTADSVIFAAVRLSALGLNDLNNLLTKADELGRKRIFVITQSVDRRAYQLLQFHEVRITAVKMRAVYRWLSKRGALPNLKRVKQKFSLSAFFEAALRRSNLKNYLFSGVILVSVAFLTPLKIYYLVFGSISLLWHCSRSHLSAKAISAATRFSTDFAPRPKRLPKAKATPKMVRNRAKTPRTTRTKYSRTTVGITNRTERPPTANDFCKYKNKRLKLFPHRVIFYLWMK